MEKEAHCSDYQPYGGGEVQFIFTYGSCKYDLSPGMTTFRGVLCDGCGEKFVDKMEMTCTGFDGEPWAEPREVKHEEEVHDNLD
jgi:hypothetical protein